MDRRSHRGELRIGISFRARFLSRVSRRWHADDACALPVGFLSVWRPSVRSSSNPAGNRHVFTVEHGPALKGRAPIFFGPRNIRIHGRKWGNQILQGDQCRWEATFYRAHQAPGPTCRSDASGHKIFRDLTSYAHTVRPTWRAKNSRP